MFLFVFTIVSCRELPVEDSNDVEVALTMERSEYKSDQRIAFSLTNNTNDAILVYRNCLQVDQKINGEWEFFTYEQDTCHSTNSRVPVGTFSRWGGVFFNREVAEGEYRVAMDVLLQEDWRQRERITSNSFKIQD